MKTIKFNKMNEQEQLGYFITAAQTAGIQTSVPVLDLLLSTYNLVLQKKGETTLMDLAEVKVKIDNKYKSKTPQTNEI